MTGAVRRLGGVPWAPRAGGEREALLAAWSSLERARERSRAEAVDLAFELAARLVGELARERPDALRASLRDAARTMGDAPAVLARAHPDDVDSCREALVGGPFAFEVAPDEGVSRGGVVLESSRGVVDARLEVRLARLRALLERGL